MSDKLKGFQSKQSGPLYGFNSNGGLRGSAPMGTQSQGSVTGVYKPGRAGSVSADLNPAWKSVVTRGHTTGTVQRKSSPHHTHVPGGAVAEPRKAHHGGMSGRGKRRHSVAEDSGKY